MGNTVFFDVNRSRFRNGLAEVSGRWGWYFALGVFLIVMGVVASGMAVATTLLSVVTLGWVMLIAGIGMVIFSFMRGEWSGFLLTLATGALSVIAGITLLSYPVSGAVAVTLMVGSILIGTGIYRSLASLVMQFPNWGWALISGFASFAIGLMLVRNWQTASLYFLGLYVGLDLIIHGLSWTMFALRIRNLAGRLNAGEAVEEERRRAA